MCLNKQNSEYASRPKYSKVLNVVGFSICKCYTALTLNIPEHAVNVSRSSSLYLVLNISWVLNMPGLSIRQSSEYVGVTHGSKYATVWLKMSEQKVNMRKYA